MDSLPLRFGVHFSSDTQIALFDCKDLGPDYRYSERHHFEAQFSDVNDPKSKPLLGHFVLVDKYGDGRWALVTVWCGDDRDTEFYLSETLKQMRLNGKLTPAKLIKMHPHYVKGEVNNSGALVDFLVKDLTQGERDKVRALEQKANADAEKKLADDAIYKKEIDRVKSVGYEAITALEDKEIENQKQHQKILELEERERKRLQAEETRALSERSTATLSNSDTLTKVVLQVSHRGSSCTVITLGDNTKRYLKTATFDQDGKVTARAQSLLGKRVRTTCWDPIYEPGKWSSQGYFRDIYELD